MAFYSRMLISPRALHKRLHVKITYLGNYSTHYVHYNISQERFISDFALFTRNGIRRFTPRGPPFRPLLGPIARLLSSISGIY
jgi:hypothetical protein